MSLCSLDISKAFDSVNHVILFNKLLDRNLPKSLVLCLVNWYSKMEIVVRWGNTFSRPTRLSLGVRQGSVLAPSFFSVYVNNILSKLAASNLGCHIKGLAFNAVMYADDLILMSLSLADLRCMILLCSELFLESLLHLNNLKSTCIRIGPRHLHALPLVCGSLSFAFGSSLKYLGSTLEAGPSFKCSLQGSKQKFYSASNCIFSKIGVDSNAYTLTLSLADSCSVPVLLYNLEALGNKRSTLDSIDFIYNSIFAKLFKIKDIFNIRFCQYSTGYLPISIRLELRFIKFYEGLRFDNTGSLASNLFILLGDQVYNDMFLRYNLSDLAPLSHNVKQYRAWQLFRESLQS